MPAPKNAAEHARDTHERFLALSRTAVADALATRDVRICNAHAAGMSPPEIAKAVGLTRQRVWQIVQAAS